MKILINKSIPQSIGFIVGAVIFAPLGVYALVYIAGGICNLLKICQGAKGWGLIVLSVGLGVGIALGGTLGQLIGEVYEKYNYK